MGKLMDPRYPLCAPSSPALILEVLEDAIMETRACRKRPRPNLSARSGPRSAASRTVHISSGHSFLGA